MIYILKKLLDILFPIECLGCGKNNVLLCEDCFNSLKTNKPNYFDDKHIDQVHICVSFENKLSQKIIHLYKYQYIEKLSEYLSKLAVNYYSQVNNKLDNPIIIPVPLHKKKFSIRCFNQALLIAEKFSNHFNYSLNIDLVIRIKNTKQQARLDKERRIENIKNAFEILDKNFVEGKNFIIIDDIYTTGSTVLEIAKILKNNGADEIWCIAIAKN